MPLRKTKNKRKFSKKQKSRRLRHSTISRHKAIGGHKAISRHKAIGGREIQKTYEKLYTENSKRPVFQPVLRPQPEPQPQPRNILPLEQQIANQRNANQQNEFNQWWNQLQ